jgi:hypothetical protein
MNPFAADSVVWPLTLILVALLVLRKVEQDLRPIVVAVTRGVAVQAGNNSAAYATAFLFGLTAAASAFIDVFQALDAAHLAALSWHQYAALWVKVLNPFFVAVLAYATQNKFVRVDNATGVKPPAQ